MPEQKDTPSTVAPSEAAAPAPKAPKKLQPRVAAKPAAETPAEAPAAGESAAKKPATKKPAARKPSKLDETKARNKKALADALAKAQAVKLPPPPAQPVAPEALKAAKPAKAKKVKLVRHSFSMPETEYAQIALLKKRIADFGGKVRRSELLRAGIALLSALDNVELTAAMARVERIKAGRPAKK
ncbi:hypothetical protein [Dechloromonas sp. H13]|uniref:hypothetical protein n=1 Tax=Dechloromonas sp. H13 TaxID=2570193 RepID=UPI00129176D3|nr:hypothetical protein [Dechloromonas sp. H13]